MNKADFLLLSSEGYELENTRKCWTIKKVAIGNCNDTFLVRIDSPIMGQHFGLVEKDIALVILAPRHNN